MSDTVFDRLFDKAIIQPNGCWEYTGTIMSQGFGQIFVGSKTDGTARQELAHRVAYNLVIGDIPQGMLVCQRCRNKVCINPEHLFLSDHRQVAELKIAEGKANIPIGSDNGMAKLTESDVLKIKRLLFYKMSHKGIAQIFNVDPSQISRINTGQSWKHVVWEPPCG